MLIGLHLNFRKVFSGNVAGAVPGTATPWDVSVGLREFPVLPLGTIRPWVAWKLQLCLC